MTFRFIFVSSLLMSFLVFDLSPTMADVICKTKTGTLMLHRACKSGESRVDLSRLGATGPTGASGATGSAGATGVDGTLRIYGDGSAGALDLMPGNGSLGATSQYSSITIRPGGVLYVPSGAILRSTGSCDIEGDIIVNSFAQGGSGPTTSLGNLISSGNLSPGASFSGGSPSSGTVGNAGDLIKGGLSCAGALNNSNSQEIISLGLNGGSGGAGGNSSQFPGGVGGGTLTILCEGDLTFGSGSDVRAEGVAPMGGSVGDGGAGGGGGGVIFAASKTLVKALPGSSISVKGGPGMNSNTNVAAGGGGGGGKILFIAPSLNLLGTTDVSGGAAGQAVTQVTSNIAMSGGAGGCSAGYGGDGGRVQIGRPVTPNNAQSGQSGDASSILVDPTSLF